MKTPPKNEQELIELKNFLGESEANLLKAKSEVDCISLYLNLFAKYSHEFPFEQVENYYLLKQWPSEVKMSFMEGTRMS